MTANLRTIPVRTSLVLIALSLVTSPVLSMSVVGELAIPDFHLETDSPQRTIYEVSQRLHRHQDVDVASQVADSHGEYHFKFYVPSIDGPGPGPNVHVWLILRVVPSGISITGSFVSAWGITDEELAELYPRVIRPIIVSVVGGGE